MNGAAVITQYRSLSIFGNEGYVTMWARRACPDEEQDQEGDQDNNDQDDGEDRPMKRAKSSDDNGKNP